MAPRSSQQRRTIAPNEHIYELGVAGRKTGITLKDSGIRDEHGMEPIDALFSSPRKPDGDYKENHPEGSSDDDDDDDDDDGTGEAMDITTTSGIGPAALLNGHGNRLSIPLPRARSPVKTSLNSPAQRNRLLGRGSSPLRGEIVRERDSQTSRDRSAATKRRLDLGNRIPKLSAVDNSARSQTNSHKSHAPQEDSDDEEQQDENGVQEDDDVGSYVEESMAMLSAEISLELEQQEGDGDDGEDAPSEAEQEEEPEAAGSDESEEVILKGRKNSKKQPAPAPASEVRSRKRRSLNTEDAVTDSDVGGRQPKRPRTEAKSTQPAPAATGRGRPPKKAAAPVSEEVEQPEKSKPAAKGKKGGKRKSSILPGDTSHVVIPRGPPLPKSRGLLINRRELPGEDGMLRTRSGRNSFKPLAYWRNERVDYDPEEAMTDAFATKSHPGKFLLPSIKEVVRVDEPESQSTSSKSRRGASRRGGPGAKSGGRRGKGRKGGYDSDDDDECAPADPWEADPGTIEGHVVSWQPEHEFNPPALDELVDVEEKQLAISSDAVATQPVKDATFRYAKTLSEGFFNCGVVDLPPGSEKRPKNSRKMFMSFFVHSGRVLVTVNETSFRISKGGMWFVPRGNYYSIENDYDQPARIFFSQGCEVAPRPAADEDEG